MGLQDRRIKRRLLREVVDDNVELLSGRPAVAARRRGRTRRATRVALIVATPAALLAWTLVLSGAVAPGGADLGFGGGLERDAAAPAGAAPDAVGRSVAAAGGPAAPAREESTGGAEPVSTHAAPVALPAVFSQPERIDASVFPLGVRRIVIDPGHGGENLGTRIPGGLEEKLITLDIGKKVEEALSTRGFEVILTRHGDEGITLQQRAELANRMRADIFVSIHVNWLRGSRDSGIETYFLGPTDDPFLTELAARENRESGHTLAELRDILDGIYAGVRHDKSQDLAESIHRSMYRSLKRVNPALRNRGVKTAPFLVLVDTRMPAVLAEVAALSNAAEAEMLEKPLYREYIADSLAAGIISYAESLGGTGPETGPEPGEEPPEAATTRAAAP